LRVPLFDLKSLGRICRSRCTDFRSAAHVGPQSWQTIRLKCDRLYVQPCRPECSRARGTTEPASGPATIAPRRLLQVTANTTILVVVPPRRRCRASPPAIGVNHVRRKFFTVGLAAVGEHGTRLDQGGTDRDYTQKDDGQSVKPIESCADASVRNRSVASLRRPAADERTTAEFMR
jgi:hypothetical protein